MSKLLFILLKILELGHSAEVIAVSQLRTRFNIGPAGRHLLRNSVK